ncbi:MAG TPA: OmpA family protein [Chitinophagaceae bacterium]|nr:OmpA family protein [Chitinophagaceae bacterium]
MASKKYSLLTGVLCLFASYGFSQSGTTGTYDVADSSVVPSRKMPQHTEFMNGTYNFPAKPRNQWEIGIKAGMFTPSTDVAALITPGFGAHIRKAFGYVFSMRLEYMYGIGKGLNYLPSGNFGKNPAWTGYTVGPNVVYYNYKTKVQDLALEGLFTLNNIRFHKSKAGFNVYGIAGIGGSTYDTRVNARNESGAIYNFNNVAGGSWKNRKQTRDALKDIMDDSYETPAENHGERRPKLFGNTFRPTGHLGAGVAFKINNRLNIAIEDRYTIIKDDLLDGQRWQEQPFRDAALTPDYDSYNFASVGLNINLGAKSTEPLWWLNPLDYAYSEIRNPRLMRLPKPVLPDADGDGVTDQFDLEQTPQGVPVDTHGVSRDTDGDGVPDARDKELVTPTYCQPVDADGVGKCPCPDSSCFAGLVMRNACETSLGALPSVTFTGNNARLTADARALLTTVASRLRNSPECRIVVTGYCQSNKQEQQRSWDRVNAVINHLVEKEGISADRFIFQSGQEGGDCNTVDLRAAQQGEEGPNTVPAPHPNLRRG